MEFFFMKILFFMCHVRPLPTPSKLSSFKQQTGRAELAELKNQLFGKKKIQIFRQIKFFFSKIFLKNFLVPKPTREWHT